MISRVEQLEIPEQQPARLALEALLAGMHSGDSSPSVTMLHGPSGGGKSFLVRQFVESLGFELRVELLRAAEDYSPQRIENAGEHVDDLDVLVVEDLQFLPPGAVSWFCRTLDRREALGLATIVTASAGPRHLRFRGLAYPARLTSRLAGGNVVSVPLPSLPSRRLALDGLLVAAGLQPPAEVVDLIAQQSRTLRSLEGAVSQLKLMTQLHGGALKVGPLLRHFRAQAAGDQPKIERIVQCVAGHFQVAAKDVRSRSRQRGFVIPRHVSMYLIRRLTEMSFQEIGDYFGGCDHATVLHACRKMERTVEADPQLGGTVRQLQGDLE